VCVHNHSIKLCLSTKAFHLRLVYFSSCFFFYVLKRVQFWGKTQSFIHNVDSFAVSEIADSCVRELELSQKQYKSHSCFLLVAYFTIK